MEKEIVIFFIKAVSFARFSMVLASRKCSIFLHLLQFVVRIVEQAQETLQDVMSVEQIVAGQTSFFCEQNVTIFFLH